ncbi:MAG: PEP-CTERM/exosortase system-associated acyltransferase [Candidatus Omnitrophota bacterium]
MSISCFKVETAEALRRFYRLRFQVYCRECGYFNEHQYPEGAESDAYDDSSVHFCAGDKEGNLIAGVRLILPDCGKFPIEHASPDVDLERLGVKRQECAEISRLVISREQRKRAGIVSSSQMSPLVTDLCEQMYRECERRGIRYCLAMMAPSLHLLLKMHHFPFQQVGEGFEYFGKVYPYLIDVTKVGQDRQAKGFSDKRPVLRPTLARG